VARELGYVIIDTNGNEYNLVRKIHGDTYPRFHIYLKSRPAGRGSSAKPGQSGYDFKFSLHLDQKKPVYEGSHAHNGEYIGPVVESEADRIIDLLKNTDQ
jgi:hypothetical protein